MVYVFVLIYYILISTNEMTLIASVNLNNATDACLHIQLIQYCGSMTLSMQFHHSSSVCTTSLLKVLF